MVLMLCVAILCCGMANGVIIGFHGSIGHYLKVPGGGDGRFYPTANLEGVSKKIMAKKS